MIVYIAFYYISIRFLKRSYDIMIFFHNIKYPHIHRIVCVYLNLL